MATTKLVIASTKAVDEAAPAEAMFVGILIRSTYQIREEQKEEKPDGKKKKKEKKAATEQSDIQQNLLDLVTAFVPYLDMTNTELLFRAIDPLMRGENNTTRKKALKVCVIFIRFAL